MCPELKVVFHAPVSRNGCAHEEDVLVTKLLFQGVSKQMGFLSGSYIS